MVRTAFLPLALASLSSCLASTQNESPSCPALPPMVKGLVTRLEEEPVVGSGLSLDAGHKLCGTCISFMDSGINALVNYLANVGVIGTCGKVCTDVFPSQLESTVCSLLCDIVGIKVFVAVLEKVDPDSIPICEAFKICEARDDSAAHVGDISVSPATGPLGTLFEFTHMLTVDAQIGTGEVHIRVQSEDGKVRVGGGSVVHDLVEGNYPVKFSLDTTPPEDPTEAAPGSVFKPGNYKVEISACEGHCGSKHKHSRQLDVQSSTFVLQGKSGHLGGAWQFSQETKEKREAVAFLQ
uniref:Saposin B-type domain-containing protein n=1 Tax=Chromera velia CCMP2878 TaxID=1169474 RepID=A0A0G4GQS4_9ALVE|mmetsp:Transcript_49793/g.98129  ORF Transcript_49793/g.98129 Transcript_49793/m.98129 type:complete len:295 (+) Transcript_49793:136-1020(+)|eukprot:Cvel_22910.t1-p1 / transcript=Cvel_22910.t1 / gene=Cvel_22910 / organism=Chromera_velia_CCMP2878 / gene_product=Countin-1, putative / transcript_product=Countin-1, putative / location=Cvel_scaffold2302:22341-24769(-) / protein_length=294 / sequence_SO=supercontig / SO=protein_coding / is_pseudo=false